MIARVGPVKVPGATAVVRFDLGRGEFKRRVGWFDAPIVADADGWIGPGTLSAPVVRFVLHDPVPGERTVSLPMINTVHAWLGTSVVVGGEEVQVRFLLVDRLRQTGQIADVHLPMTPRSHASVASAWQTNSMCPPSISVSSAPGIAAAVLRPWSAGSSR